MLPTVELFDSKGKVLGILVLGIVMTAAGGFCLTLQQIEAQVAGCSALVFFGAFTVYLIRRLFSRKALVVFGEEGVEDLRWRIGRIPWSEIEGFEIQTMRTHAVEHQFIGVLLRDESAYASKVPFHKKAAFSLNKAMGFSFFTINCKGLEADLEDTVRVLRDYHSSMTTTGQLSGFQRTDLDT